MEPNVSDLLTPREREVLALMSDGLTNGEIADRLGISFATAKTHVSEILARLGADSREEAVAIWTGQRPASRWRGWLALPVFRIVGGAGVAAVVGGVAIAGVLHWRAGPAASELRVPLASLAEETPYEVHVPQAGESQHGTPYPVWLVRRADGSVDAFIGRDPHGGCIVRYESSYEWDWTTEIWSDDRARLLRTIPPFVGAFKAGCTGWVFGRDGDLYFGAPERGLDRFPTRIEGDEVVVELDTFLLGRCAGRDSGRCSMPHAEVSVTELPQTQILAGFGP